MSLKERYANNAEYKESVDTIVRMLRDGKLKNFTDLYGAVELAIELAIEDYKKQTKPESEGG